jgi:hypothetical protein
MSLLDEGFKLFDAKIRDFGDGREDCSATLSAFYGEAMEQSDYEGTTKGGHGHAELDALYRFLDDIGWDTNAFSNYVLQITCTAKPCCKYCSAVMGLLGISPGHGTYKVNKSMGISYVIPPKIREFIGKFGGYSQSKVEKELQAGWL